jgi:transcription factor 7-like 2
LSSFCLDCLNPKKCRARFGLEGQSQWCKHCRRKKKCTRFLEDDMPNNQSSFGSPTTAQSDDSMDEPDSDDVLSRQIDSIEDEHDDSDEENKQHKPIDSHQQQFYLPPPAHSYQSSGLPPHFTPSFRY